LLGSLASIQSVGMTLDTASKTIESAGPMLDTVSKLLDEDLTNTIKATQASIYSAQQSAGVVDSVLGALSFLPGISYNPGSSLSAGLGEVSYSLEDLPQSLSDMASSLSDTRHNMQTFQVDLALMKDALRQVETSMTHYEDVIEGYHSSVTQVQTQLSEMEKNLPTLVRGMTWGVTIFLIWMAIAQLGLFAQGWELLTRRTQEQKAKQISDSSERVSLEALPTPEVLSEEFAASPPKENVHSEEETNSDGD